MQYYIHLAILVGIYILLAQSLNLTFGSGGLFNLAHVAVYAIGAYTTAILSTELELNFWYCILASMTAGAFFSLLLGGIALKLNKDYFAIGTLAFSSVVSAVLVNFKSLTRGPLGIPGIPKPEILGVDFYENTNFLILLSIFVVISLIILHLVFRSSFARKLRMQAEYTQATEALGVSVRKVRNRSFVISSIFAALAGSFFAYYINFIDPSSFGLHEMVFVLSIVVLGKPGSFWGVVAATFFLVLLPEPLRFLEIDSSILGPMRQFLYAAVLFLVVYLRRASLFPAERLV